MPDANDMMEAYGQDAVDLAAQLKKDLDYSEDSIKTVEEICTLLYNSIPKTFFARLFKKKPSEEKMLQMSKMFGGYIGEVMIKHYGGNWEVEDFMNEGNTIVLTIGDMKIFPVGKVYKRLANGPEDNVSHFYRFIIQELKKPS